MHSYLQILLCYYIFYVFIPKYTIAVGDVLAEMAKGFSKQAGNLIEPVDRLKTMLKELCNVAVTNEKLIRFMATQGIKEIKRCKH